MAKLTHLPRPHPQYGWYKLPDESRIYPSGGYARQVQPGKWFVWFYMGEELQGGKVCSVGRILMTRTGIRYFDSPEEALQAVRRQRGTGVIGD